MIVLAKTDDGRAINKRVVPKSRNLSQMMASPSVEVLNLHFRTLLKSIVMMMMMMKNLLETEKLLLQTPVLQSL